MVLFLTNILLKEKDDFSKIWLAAHWEKKLKRYQICQVDIESCVKDIMELDIILDLRLSGHLLIGIVKIFSRKTKYLLTECSDIFNRVKIFRSTVTDLAPNKLQAQLKSINIDDLGVLDEHNLGNFEEDFVSHQSRLEEITLKETAGDMQLITDDDFEFNLENEINPINFEEEINILNAFSNSEAKKNQLRKVSQQNMEVTTSDKDAQNIEMGLDDELGYGSMDGTDDSSGANRKCNPHVSISKELISIASAFRKVNKEDNILNLEPLDGMFDVQRKSRRKRKLVIDQIKTMDKEKFEKQLQCTLDITVPLEMAPPSKRLMILKEIGSSEKLLHLPGQKFGSIQILNLFKRNLRVYKVEENASSCDEESCSFHSPEHPRAPPVANINNSPLQDLNDCYLEEGGNDVILNNENSDSSSHDHVPENTNNGQNMFPSEIQDSALSIEASEDVDSKLQKRVIGLLQDMRILFQRNKEIKFSDLVKHDRRVKVAGKFQSLLLLKKFNLVELMQTKSYGEIFISKGSSFTPMSSQLI